MQTARAPLETFSLQLGLAAPVAELEAWLADAPAGGRAIYASGFDLPRAAEAVQLVNQWQREGRATLTSQRDPADKRRTLWLVIKVSPDAPGKEAGEGCARRAQVAEGGSAFRRPSPASTLDFETRAQCRALLDLLRHAALRGEACGSNLDLARALDLAVSSARQRSRSRNRVQYLLACLAERGEIHVETHGRNLPRVVTIRAKGRAQGKSTLKQGSRTCPADR